MKSKAIIIFVIISSIFSGFSSINNNTIGQSPKEDKKAEYSTASRITQTAKPTPEQTVEPTQVLTIEPTISPAAEPTISNSPEKTTDKINPEYLIIPGVSLGKIKLNMKAKEVYKFFGIPSKKDSESITFQLFTNIKQAENLIEGFIDAFRRRQAIFWGISFKNKPDIIGFCKCEIEIPKVRADLGYDLQNEYWNMGIMTETLSAVIKYAFKILNVNRIEATVSTNNKSSIKVLEKSGFVKEGILRERCYISDIYHDMMMLSILKKEYSDCQGVHNFNI